MTPKKPDQEMVDLLAKTMADVERVLPKEHKGFVLFVDIEGEGLIGCSVPQGEYAVEEFVASQQLMMKMCRATKFWWDMAEQKGPRLARPEALN